MLSLIIIFCAGDSFAAAAAPTPAASSVGKALCTAAWFFNGNLGKGIACLGVTIVGISALYGKVTWVTASLVGVGVAVIFGADAIIIAIGGFKCF